MRFGVGMRLGTGYSEAGILGRVGVASRPRRFASLLAILLALVAVAIAVGAGAAQAEPMPIGVPGTWALALNEEFTASGPNPALWTPEWGGPMSGECTSPSLASQPGNGYLYLQVRAQESTCGGTKHADTGALVESNPDDGVPGHAGFQYSYGYVEWRVYVVGSGGEPECPRGGCIPDWPALWSLPQNSETEFDTFEGLKGQACYHFWHHFEPAYQEGGCATASYAGWHTYGVDWEPGNLKYYYDGTKVWEYSSGYINSALQYLIMDDVAPGSYGGKLVVPDEILVDYVRVWTRPAQAASSWATRESLTKSQWVFYAGSGGAVGQWYWNQGAQKWEQGTLGSTVASGTTPTVVREPSSGAQWVFYTESGGAIAQWYWNQGAGKWEHGTLGGTAASGTSPTAVRDPSSNGLWVYYVESGGAIAQWWWNQGAGKWEHGTLGGTAASGTSPTAVREPSSGAQWVFYTEPGGAIAQWYWNQNAGKWEPGTL
jgi:hypothetical protein